MKPNEQDFVNTVLMQDTPTEKQPIVLYTIAINGTMSNKACHCIIRAWTSNYTVPYIYQLYASQMKPRFIVNQARKTNKIILSALELTIHLLNRMNPDCTSRGNTTTVLSTQTHF